MSSPWALGWAPPFFGIGESGRLWVSPAGSEQQIDLPRLVEGLVTEGARAPMLLAFPQIIQARLDLLRSTMERVQARTQYEGSYQPIYPIKVNQHHQVLRCLEEAPGLAGFEAGSKPELMLTLSLLKPGQLLVCNGYKDAEYLQMALYAQLLGYRPIIVIERLSELDLALKVGDKMGVEVEIGLRARLADHGSGRWSSSAGDLSKFGLTTPEIVAAAQQLQAREQLHCLRLLHFHIGSQLTELDSTEQAITEASQIYRGLVELGANRLEMLDVGGGLAVDYGDEGDGGSSAYLEHYFTRIISGVQKVLRPKNIPVPNIVTEAGRALVAHHGVLIMEVIDSSTRPSSEVDWNLENCPEELIALEQRIHSFQEGDISTQIKALQELRRQLGDAFEAGDLSLEHMALTERMYWSGLAWLAQHTKAGTTESHDLEKLLADCLYCNFSLFQSLPDHWALSQLFPILPLQLTHGPSTRRARIVDITCDSDGGLTRYPQAAGPKETLPLPPLRPDQPNYLAAFLAGAYQDSIGDLHNLFGDSDRATVWVDDGDHVSTELIPGQTIASVIEAMGHARHRLLDALDTALDRSVRMAKISPDQAEQIRRNYRQNLEGYTYLEDNELS